MNPLSAVIRAVTFPFKWVFVVGLCFVINWVTSPDEWWFQWVAFGMTVALIVIWARALKVIVMTIGLAGAGYMIHRWWTGRSARKASDPRTIDSGSY